MWRRIIAGRNEDYFDIESAIYYEREKIPQLEYELEYYKKLLY